jgi:DNA damage-binding protein 1
LSHDEWRSYRAELRREPAKGFIDGDLVEQFLDLPSDQAAAVVTGMGGDLTVAEVTQRVEELSRLH